MQRILALFMVLLLLPSAAFATSIVAVRNNDEIVIGADSKTTLTQVYDSVPEPQGVVKCKIVQAGGLFFASAGSAGIGRITLGGYVEPEFDVKELVARGLSGEGKIREKVGGLEKLLVLNLTQLAEKIRRDNPAFFMQRFLKNPVHTIIIAGLEDEKLVLMVRTFRLVVQPSGSLSFEVGRFTCPGDCRESFVTIFEGQTDAIRKYLRGNENFLYYTDPAVAVRDLVEMEISDDPSSVGPPVDILRLTRRGAEWIQKKSLCPDIHNQSP
jgi:hypothetical protein